MYKRLLKTNLIVGFEQLSSAVVILEPEVKINEKETSSRKSMASKANRRTHNINMKQELESLHT